MLIHPFPDLGKILFLDVETVAGARTYDDLDELMQECWRIKCKSVLRKYDEPITEAEAQQAYSDRAGIFSEFGKIVCISVGIIRRKPEDKKLSVTLKSFAGDNEAELLKDFSLIVSRHFKNESDYYFCGHNIKEFDIPYICRRMVVNRVPLPSPLRIAGKKPWELRYMLDTLELWKFGDRKNYTSLKLLAATLGFPSPKDDIDGSNVNGAYWEEEDLDRISRYCEKDVLATIQLYLRLNLLPLIEETAAVSLTFP